MISYKNKILFYFLFSLSFSQYDSFNYDFLKNKKEKVISKEKPKSKNSYENLIKGFSTKNGLFDFYWNEDMGKCYISLSKKTLR